MKIEEQVLSREQMAYLKALGVDTSDASMAYYYIPCTDGGGKWILGIANGVITSMMGSGFSEIVYTYTIGDLIEKLPKFFYKGDEDNLKMGALNGTGAFSVEYNAISKSRKINGNIKDALYNLLCWVVENHKGLLIKNI